jgi:hypothetical protein
MIKRIVVERPKQALAPNSCHPTVKAKFEWKTVGK